MATLHKLKLVVESLKEKPIIEILDLVSEIQKKQPSFEVHIIRDVEIG